MRKIFSLAAAGVLTVGLAACGKSTNDNAGASSPSPVVSAAPDKESCSQGQALALLAGLRMAGVMVALELKTQADAAAAMGDVVTQAAQAKSEVTDPQVKAIVEEYQATIDQLKKQLETPGADKDKLSTDIEAAADKFDKTAEKLETLCKEPESDPQPGASGATKPVGCDKVGVATLALLDPMLSVSLAGTDKAKLEAAMKELNTALDAYVSELTKVAGETTDSAFKAALTTAASDVQKLKQTLATAGGDPNKVESIMSDDAFSTSQEKVQSFCS